MLKRLKTLRELSGVTQKQLAEAVGVSQQSINKYENHNIEPDIATLILLADFFHTSVDYLIGHTDLRHTLEVVRPHDLNAEESEFLEAYRRLNVPQRESVRGIVSLFSEK